IPGVRFRHPTEINLVLVSLPQPVWDGLVADGYSFSRRGAPSEGVIRIACAFDTTEEAVDALLAAAYHHAGSRPNAQRPEGGVGEPTADCYGRRSATATPSPPQARSETRAGGVRRTTLPFRHPKGASTSRTGSR